ncbi:MAG: hypothetical protein AAGK38_03160 [Pseudomonadota bacterium]
MLHRTCPTPVALFQPPTVLTMAMELLNFGPSAKHGSGGLFEFVAGQVFKLGLRILILRFIKIGAHEAGFSLPFSSHPRGRGSPLLTLY